METNLTWSKFPDPRSERKGRKGETGRERRWQSVPVLSLTGDLGLVPSGPPALRMHWVSRVVLRAADGMEMGSSWPRHVQGWATRGHQHWHSLWSLPHSVHAELGCAEEPETRESWRSQGGFTDPKFSPHLPSSVTCPIDRAHPGFCAFFLRDTPPWFVPWITVHSDISGKLRHENL